MVGYNINYYSTQSDASAAINQIAGVLSTDSNPWTISSANCTTIAAPGCAYVASISDPVNGRGWMVALGPAGTNGTGPFFDGHTFTNTGGLYRLYPTPYPCFLEGSKILCQIEGKEEYRPIETLRNGTLVKTSRDGFKPVAMIGHSKIYNPSNDSRSTNRLYRCPTKNYPDLTEELIITGQHSILVDTLTDEQRKLILEHMGDIYVTDKKYRLIAAVDERAEPYVSEGVFTIWHLALEHENYYMNYGIYANGLLVETMSQRYLKEHSGLTLV